MHLTTETPPQDFLAVQTDAARPLLYRPALMVCLSDEEEIERLHAEATTEGNHRR